MESSKHTSAERSDLVVVGAGVIGLAIAWRAAERGLRVSVLERDRAGSGASGVAAGMLAPVGEATWNQEDFLALALASHRAWPAFAAELQRAAGTPTGYRETGALHVALDRDEAEALHRRHELLRSLGLEAGWLRPVACRAAEPGLSPRLAGGVWVPGEAAIRPRDLVAALAKAATTNAKVEDRAGSSEHDRSGITAARVLEGCAAAELIVEGGAAAGVVDEHGAEHRADAVVVANGAWAGTAEWLPEEARPPVRPVKGELIELQGAEVCRGIVAGERFYAVPRAGGRLVVGATVEERGFDTGVTAGGLLELLRESYRALPDVAELNVVALEAGLRPGTPDNRPLIGPGAIPGLILATGHFRNGVLLAPITADAVVAEVTGGDPPADLAPFRPDRFDVAVRA